MAFLGQHGDYQWSVAEEVPGLRLEEIVRSHHHGCLLCITSFDSGPLRVSNEEKLLGWVQLNDRVAMSPRLDDDLEIPVCGECDKYYVFDASPGTDWRPEVFVNNLGFTVVPVDVLHAAREPTWERPTWLEPHQEHFWKQVEACRPITYVGRGGLDIVVTQRPELIEAISRTARERAG